MMELNTMVTQMVTTNTMLLMVATITIPQHMNTPMIIRPKNTTTEIMMEATTNT